MIAVQNLQCTESRYRHVTAWARQQLEHGRSLPAVEMSVSMIPVVQGLIQLCELDLIAIPVAPVPRLTRWHEMWKSSRCMWTDAAKNCDPTAGSAVEEIYQFLDEEQTSSFAIPLLICAAIEELSSMPLGSRRAMGRLHSMRSRESRTAFLQSIDQILDGNVEAIAPSPAVDDLDPFLFLAKIRIPCFARFGLAPEMIYQGAVTGDRQSLARMLSLDSSVEMMPEIREILMGDLRTGNPSLLGKSLLKRMSSVGLDKTSCKALAIAWCREWSRLLQSLARPEFRRFMQAAYGVTTTECRPFTIDQLRELFDAYAKDQGRLIDEDLQADGDALRKIVVRLGTSFPLRAWDIFASQNVPMK